MRLESPFAIAALVLGLSAGAAADAASATCRKVHTGAVERVCRWQVGKGEFVNVYYGQPSPPAAPGPIRQEADYAPPPVSYPATVYYDYGHALPFAVRADAAHARVRHHAAGLTPVGRRPASFHGGTQGLVQSGGLRSRGGNWRR